jgi:FlaA1/EpsC-like NDP-sugar epimerase
MGEQIKVVDRPRNMIVLPDLVPDQDVQVVYSGLHPEEKLYEKLFEETEQIEPTAHLKVRRAISASATQSDSDVSSLPVKVCWTGIDSERVIERICSNV